MKTIVSIHTCTYILQYSTPMYLYFVVAREIDLTDGAQTYTLVGVVNGNPKGCRDERDFPDYHTSIGNAEVCTVSKLILKSVPP